MSKEKRDKLRETIADLIAHGMSDRDIAHEIYDLIPGAIEWELIDLLVGVVRDEMTEKVEE